MRIVSDLLIMALLWSLPVAVQTSAAVPQLRPVDEAPRQSDFLTFRMTALIAGD